MASRDWVGSLRQLPDSTHSNAGVRQRSFHSADCRQASHRLKRCSGRVCSKKARTRLPVNCTMGSPSLFLPGFSQSNCLARCRSRSSRT